MMDSLDDLVKRMSQEKFILVFPQPLAVNKTEEELMVYPSDVDQAVAVFADGTQNLFPLMIAKGMFARGFPVSNDGLNLISFVGHVRNKFGRRFAGYYETPLFKDPDWDAVSDMFEQPGFPDLWFFAWGDEYAALFVYSQDETSYVLLEAWVKECKDKMPTSLAEAAKEIRNLRVRGFVVGCLAAKELDKQAWLDQIIKHHSSI
jgi:hypothetical protein